MACDLISLSCLIRPFSYTVSIALMSWSSVHYWLLMSLLRKKMWSANFERTFIFGTVNLYETIPVHNLQIILVEFCSRISPSTVYKFIRGRSVKSYTSVVSLFYRHTPYTMTAVRIELDNWNVCGSRRETKKNCKNTSNWEII